MEPNRLMLIILSTFLLVFIGPITSLDTAYEINCDTVDCSCYDSELKCILDNVTLVDYTEKKNVTLLDLAENNLRGIEFQRVVRTIKYINLKKNNIKVIPEKQFINLPNLSYLDISNNQIEILTENAFLNLEHLTTLNLSHSFVDGFMLKRQLCELIKLEIVDLGGLNLADFSLECWKKEGNIIQLHMKGTSNVEKSWSNWFPYIGNKLKVLDLSDSHLHSINSNLARNLPSLKYISISNNPNIEKDSILNLLKTVDLIDRLEYLYLANISANTKNLDLELIINHSNNISLIELDISNNDYSAIDLNTFLFNQAKFKSLKSFRASNSSFTGCEKSLVSNETSLLPYLEELDLSYNQLAGSKCMYSIRLCKQLRYLDLNHNKINLLHSDLVSHEMVSIFADMTHLSYIDLSYNNIIELILNFKPYHTKLDKLDLSHNNIEYFCFLSQHMIQSSNFPMNLEDEGHNYEDYDYMDAEFGSVSFSNEHGKDDSIYDDDERFLIIDYLDLSGNHLKYINLKHMMQSIRNVRRLDLSRNPIEKVIRLSGERSIIDNQPIEEDEFTEILCIDELDLSNCKIRHLPNFEHTCINKISMKHNNLKEKQHLVISKFSTYFMDYLDLQWNNITDLKPIISNQKFKEDSYKNKNSPIGYYLGSKYSEPDSKIHTYVDLKENKFFKCDCDVIIQFQKFTSIQILNECVDKKEFRDTCFIQHQSIKDLNKKFRTIFGFISIVLLILTGILIYYMCSDCIKNMQPCEKIQFCARQFFSRFKWDKLESDGLGPTGNIRQTQNSKVIYSKLDNETNASNVNLDI